MFYVNCRDCVYNCVCVCYGVIEKVQLAGKTDEEMYPSDLVSLKFFSCISVRIVDIHRVMEYLAFPPTEVLQV